MKYLIILITFLALSSEATEDVVFIGEPIESHIFVRPISVEKLTELGVPSPLSTFNNIEGSNNCGIEITVYKVLEPLAGKLKDNVTTYSFLGEWCQSNIEMSKRKIFHIFPSDHFSHVLEYQYVYDQKLGLTIPGSGHSGMAFLDVNFRDALKKLDDPVYAGSEVEFTHWKEAVSHKEIIFIDGKAYFTTGVSVHEILSKKF